MTSADRDTSEGRRDTAVVTVLIIYANTFILIILKQEYLMITMRRGSYCRMEYRPFGWDASDFPSFWQTVESSSWL